MDDFASFSNQNDLMKAAEAAGCKGKSEEDILKEIYRRAAEGKRNGTLTNDQIDAFCRQLAPMLDPPKRKRLDRIVRELKQL